MRRSAALLLLVACSDYNFAEPDKTNPAPDTAEPEPGLPGIEVSPEQLELGVICAPSAQPVTLRSVGEEPLEIWGLSIEGEGWTLSEVELPVSLEPGQALELQVSGLGSATLVVQSDDPDEPRVELPLSALENSPPLVRVLSPLSGEVLGVEEQVLVGQVEDDLDAPEALRLTWSSSVDGTISTLPAEADGSSTVSWPSPRSSGEHLIALSAVDSCGASASTDIGVCQQSGYEVEELQLDEWHFEGSGTYDEVEGHVQLTGIGAYEIGSAFEIGHEVSGRDVQIDFLFYIGEGTGADGISLTALDVSRMSTFLGGSGCGIGYGGSASCTAGPALPGWSIEVDTYENPGQDPTAEDHVMFTFDGDVDAPAAWAALPEMEDTGWHTMSVVVAAPRVTVSIDEVVYIDQELSGHFDFLAYVGFTAGTGGLTNYHRIDALTVTEYVCEEG